MAIWNPDAYKAVKVLTPTLAAWLGRPPGTIRAWVERGILPEPAKLGPKTHVHDLAAVLRALGDRVLRGEDGPRALAAQEAARRRARAAAQQAPPQASAVAGDGDVAELPDQAGDQARAGDQVGDVAELPDQADRDCGAGNGS